MDFKGQQLSERLGQGLVMVFAILGFLIGYIQQDFGMMMKIFGIGVAIAFVATVFDWPIYNKNPVVYRRRDSHAHQGSGKK